MSKPNLLGFSTSIGFYRNQKPRQLRENLLRQIPRKIAFAELAPMCFQALMAAAAENQINGDFSNYSDERWHEIFLVNHIQVSLKEACIIRKNFEAVGLTEGGKILSWSKFNRHFAEHEQIQKAKKKAGKEAAKQRAERAKQEREKAPKSLTESAPKSEKNGHQNGPDTKQVWLLQTKIAKAKGKQKKALEAELNDLLGIAPEPTVRPPAPAPTPRKPTRSEFEQTLLKNARQLLADGAYDLCHEAHAKALAQAGDQVPKELKARFPKLFTGSGDKEAEHNPVPG